MDKVNGYSIGFTGGTIKAKSSVKRFAPNYVKDAIILTAEDIAEIADKNGVNVTYSMRTKPGKSASLSSSRQAALMDERTKRLFIHVNRSNGLFKRLLAGSLKGYGEYRDPAVRGNFDAPAFVANVREIVSRYKTKSYIRTNDQVKKQVG